MKIGLVVVIAIVVIAGIFFFARPKNPCQTATTIITSPATSQAPATENTIQYTKNGFNPQSITVKVGTTVTFSDIDGGELWVASSPHPVHTDYCDFDQRTFIKNGQQYTFTFTKVGSWGYHNHLVPSNLGTVVVTP